MFYWSITCPSHMTLIHFILRLKHIIHEAHVKELLGNYFIIFIYLFCWCLFYFNIDLSSQQLNCITLQGNSAPMCWCFDFSLNLHYFGYKSAKIWKKGLTKHSTYHVTAAVSAAPYISVAGSRDTGPHLVKLLRCEHILKMNSFPMLLMLWLQSLCFVK